MEEEFSVGARLRMIRSERGLSQRELAQRAGVSANAISLIERDENSPSVATLQSLAAALNVKMSYFFDEEKPEHVLYVKAGTRPQIASNGVQIEGLGTTLKGQEMEPFLIHLDPHADSGKRQVVHTGHELVYCLRGNVEYFIDGASYALDAGDLLIFEAHLPHAWRNLGGEEAQFLLVLQTPGEKQESVQRHFSEYPSLTHMG